VHKRLVVVPKRGHQASPGLTKYVKRRSSGSGKRSVVGAEATASAGRSRSPPLSPPPLWRTEALVSAADAPGHRPKEDEEEGAAA
jgi:hypothetical protein